MLAHREGTWLNKALNGGAKFLQERERLDPDCSPSKVPVNPAQSILTLKEALFVMI